MAFENILVETDGAVCTITLNRPKALNALNSALLGEVETALLGLKDERVVIVTGSGEKAFAAGADIAQMRGLSVVQGQAYAELGHRVIRRLETIPQVTIAAINGFALGGGLELAMGCDLLYASDNAKMGQPEVNLGLMPGFGGTQRLARLIGPQLAREMIFTADPIDAATAKARGLVCEVWPRAELMEKVRAVAAKIASKAPLAVAASKRTLRRGLDLDLESGNVLEQSAFAVLFDSADTKEGLAAFLEKRPAAFKGV